MNRLFNLCLLATLLCGCRTPKIPVIDLSEPDWQERTGQAIWKMPDAPLLSVDIHFAQSESGTSWLQLSKGGLPMATVTLNKPHWKLDGSMFGRVAQGRGTPPRQAGPAQLALLLAGRPVHRDWKVEHKADHLLLAREKSGERWEVFLDE